MSITLKDLKQRHAGTLDALKHGQSQEFDFREDELKEVLNILYTLILRRDCDDAGFTHYKAKYLRERDYKNIILEIFHSEEKQAQTAPIETLSTCASYIILESFKTFAERGPCPQEYAQWFDLVCKDCNNITALILGLHKEFVSRQATQSQHSPSFHVMGTDQHVTDMQWRDKVSQSSSATPLQTSHHNTLSVQDSPTTVSIITSLYKGGRHIRRFMDNIVSQEGFRDFCELIIIDANSPDNEWAVIKDYIDNYANIHYHRCAETIPIYAAWNLAIEKTRGELITNANVDDLRRRDSLLVQASTLSHLSFADIVYQDFYYTLDDSLSFEAVAAINISSDLPLVTPISILQCNPPHNAPMWRRSLHNEVGLFNETYLSAGDYDFWCRCLLHGKHFFKINDPIVVYYNNPDGLSTRLNGPGVAESARITRQYCDLLLSDGLKQGNREFSNNSISTGYQLHHLSDRYHAVHNELLKLLSER